MKLHHSDKNRKSNKQPPSGGCVLKPDINFATNLKQKQPPSGGCVMKQRLKYPNTDATDSRLRAAVC